MKGLVQDIEGLAVKNDEFRRVLYTAKHFKRHALYAPPNHRDAVVHHTRDDAEADNHGSSRESSSRAESGNSCSD
jgi:hypothetical protein